MLQGNVLITGGAGYLGRAILRRAANDNWPAQFTVYSRDEEKQFKLRQRHPGVRCILGDIRNLDRLMLAMSGHDTIIHASAVKFVPEAEFNVCETVEVNVNGSMNVALAAHATGVRAVIGISTDKACLPVNLYGATKMTMERIFTEANKWGSADFITTRYGNVVASTGSIVPVFREMLRREGRVKVTDPEMTRFWLSPDDAVDLIVGCAAPETLAECAGDIIVPMPGAMSIGSIASTVVKLHKGVVGGIDIIGPRAGEKKHEALVSEHEAARTQLYPLRVGRRGDGEEMENLVHVIRAPGTFTKDRLSDGPGAYTSDRPRFLYTEAMMAEIIEDAETI